jgi:two-component system chemotaxis response regulator CheB
MRRAPLQFRVGAASRGALRMRDAVVVGASAGGIGALRELVHHVPPDFPAAIVAVVHISSHSPSLLPAILSAAGPLPAKAAEDREPMTEGKIYVAPPDRHLLIERGRLRLTRGPRENRVRPSVDTLFRSAAVDLGSRVVGVILSGALDDGTAGLWAIKDRGGVAIVQEPTEAEFPDMPRSALANVEVDHVLPVAAMGLKLADLATAPAPVRTPVPAAMAAEADIELGGRTANTVLELGRPSPNSCPECHGSLVEIRNGPIVRYRCHTGHAYSMGTLLAETETEIEKALWKAVRALDERAFLLRSMERRSRERGDPALADRFAADAAADEVSARRMRDLAIGASPS